MKTRDIATIHGFDLARFETWLKNFSTISTKTGFMGGLSIEDENDINQAVYDFQQYQACLLYTSPSPRD